MQFHVGDEAVLERFIFAEAFFPFPDFFFQVEHAASLYSAAGSGWLKWIMACNIFCQLVNSAASAWRPISVI